MIVKKVDSVSPANFRVFMSIYMKETSLGYNQAGY